jgi:hypothetical protein
MNMELVLEAGSAVMSILVVKPLFYFTVCNTAVHPIDCLFMFSWHLMLNVLIHLHKILFLITLKPTYS